MSHDGLLGAAARRLHARRGRDVRDDVLDAGDPAGALARFRGQPLACRPVGLGRRAGGRGRRVRAGARSRTGSGGHGRSGSRACCSCRRRSAWRSLPGSRCCSSAAHSRGSACPGCWRSAAPYVVEAFVPRIGARAMGYYVSSLVAGGLVGRLGVALASAVVGWRWRSALLVVLPLRAAIAMRGALPEPPPPVRGGGSRAISQRRLLGVSVGGGALFFTFVGTFTYVTYRLEEPPFSYSVAAASLVFLLWLTGLAARSRGGSRTGSAGGAWPRRRRPLRRRSPADAAGRPAAARARARLRRRRDVHGLHGDAARCQRRRAESTVGRPAALYFCDLLRRRRARRLRSRASRGRNGAGAGWRRRASSALVLAAAGTLRRDRPATGVRAARHVPPRRASALPQPWRRDAGRLRCAGVNRSRPAAATFSRGSSPPSARRSSSTRCSRAVVRLLSERARCTRASSTSSRTTATGSSCARPETRTSICRPDRARAREGLAWWAAERNEPAFIPDNLLDDPRVEYVPELEEERFQSLLSVPIAARDGDRDRRHQRPHRGAARVHAGGGRLPRHERVARRRRDRERAALRGDAHARARARGDHRARRGDRARRDARRAAARRSRPARRGLLAASAATCICSSRGARSSSSRRRVRRRLGARAERSASPSSARSSRVAAAPRASPCRSSPATSCSGCSSPRERGRRPRPRGRRARPRSGSRRSS